MKTNYSIKNFRVFDSKGVTIEFAPLTFLVGCNSSGKSSIVKSLSILKTFFKNTFDKDKPVVGTTIDFTTKPNDSLGSFNNVVRSSSRNKEFSLSYEVHSDYLNDDVVVALTMGDGELGNAKVKAFSISKKDGTVLVSSQHGSSILAGCPVFVKESFKQYLIATRFRAKVYSLLPSDPDLKVSPATEKKINDLEQSALLHCSSEYLSLVFKNREIKDTVTNDYVKNSVDKYADTGIMTYFSLFDEMGEMSSSEEVAYFLKSKVKEGEIHDTMIRVIEYVSECFKKSESSSFLSFYRTLEEQRLLSARSLSTQVISGDHLFAPFCFYSVGHIYAIHDNDFEMEKVGLYELTYDMLSHLVEEEPYSYVVKGEYGYAPMDHRIHPLFVDAFNDYIEKMCLEVVSKDITEGLDYISSSRIQVRRMYPMEDRNEFSEAVRRYFETKTRFMTLNPPITLNVWNENGKGDHTVQVSDFVPGGFMNKWLQIFKIGDHMSLEMDKNGLGLLLKVYNSASDKKGILLADMGYGITQLFSILLQIEEMVMSSLYETFKGRISSNGIVHIMESCEDIIFYPRTVAIEEPEIHLHPKYQSLLAEMLYEAYKEYNIQFIIETHSEYLLRKIQTLVGAKKLNPEEVSLVYVEDEEEVKKGAQKVRRIPVKADGRLASPFGPGFYDEADNLSMQLFTNMGK